MTDKNTNTAPEDRLAVIARDTSDATFQRLGYQSLAREATALEHALADNLMDIYGQSITDYDQVAQELTNRGVVAPISQKTEWTQDILLSELKQLNESFDSAYQGR